MAELESGVALAETTKPVVLALSASCYPGCCDDDVSSSGEQPCC
jgi:hypothetical protein